MTKCTKCNTSIGGVSPFCHQCGFKVKDNGISFYDYCIKNNVDYYKWWSINNKLKPDQVPYSSDKKFLFICNKNHEYKKSLTNAIKGSGCPFCVGQKVLIGFNDLWTTHPELCEELVNKEDGYKYSKGSKQKLEWKCVIDHIYKQSIVNKIKHNQGCPYCAGKKILIGFNDLCTTNQKICKELLDYNDGYKYSNGSNKKIKWKCNKCSYIWISKISNRTINKRGCPRCNKSKGENKIEEILIKYGIKYDPQKRYQECRYKNELPFDFYLPDYNILIEYQGEQHFPEHNNLLHPKGKRHCSSDLEFIQYKDSIKKNFCKRNNIILVEIPYWTFNNIENIILNIIGDDNEI